MNKPKRHKSPLIQKLQENRSAAEFEKTKKRMLLAAKIADAIKAKGWNNGDLARELDQYDSVISKWLSGTHNFTADTLFDIERVLGIKLINTAEEEQENYTRHYEISVSVKAKDLMPDTFIGESDLKSRLNQYVALCGGMAATSVTTTVNK